MLRVRSRTTVGIVGGGPAGLMLSHLLALSGIDSVVVGARTRREIEETHRAGILEQDSVRLLADTGVSDRVLRDGHRHEGIGLAFDAAGHRIDFENLVGATVQLYPQTDVFIDLADGRAPTRCGATTWSGPTAPAGPCSPSAASSRSRCATATCCSPATRPTPCLPPEPRD